MSNVKDREVPKLLFRRSVRPLCAPSCTRGNEIRIICTRDNPVPLSHASLVIFNVWRYSEARQREKSSARVLRASPSPAISRSRENSRYRGRFSAADKTTWTLLRAMNRRKYSARDSTSTFLRASARSTPDKKIIVQLGHIVRS